MEDVANLRRMQREVLRTFGHEAVRKLHRQNAFLDAVAILVPFCLFYANLVALFHVNNLALALLISAAQAVLMNFMGLANHDVFVHRKWGGATPSWIGGLALTLPIQIPVSRYTHTHLQHHRFVGTTKDTEVYKQDLTTRSRRLLFCTFFGVKRAMSGAWTGKQRPDYLAMPADSRPAFVKARVERIAYSAFLIVMVALMVMNWRVGLFGYLLPVTLLLPTLNTFRILLEHAELDDANPHHIASYYRTGPLTRLLFLWDSGDCHLVHHVLPNVPYYRVGAALRMLAPLFATWGIVPQRSYYALLRGWFVSAYGHRTRWPV